MEKVEKRTRYVATGDFKLRHNDKGGCYVIVSGGTQFKKVQGDIEPPALDDGRENYLFAVDKYAHFFVGVGAPAETEIPEDGRGVGSICVEYQSYDYRLGKSAKHWEGYKVVAVRIDSYDAFTLKWTDFAGVEND